MNDAIKECIAECKAPPLDPHWLNMPDYIHLFSFEHLVGAVIIAIVATFVFLVWSGRRNDWDHESQVGTCIVIMIVSFIWPVVIPASVFIAPAVLGGYILFKLLSRAAENVNHRAIKKPPPRESKDGYE